MQNLSQYGSRRLKFIPALNAMSIMGTLWKKRKNGIEYEANEQSVLLTTHKNAILWGITSLFFYDFCALKITDCTKERKGGNKKKDRLLYLERQKQKVSYWQGLQNIHSYICKNDTIPFCPVFFSYNYTTRKGFSDPSNNLTVMRLLRL